MNGADLHAADILVIGAGPAGLATSACLRRDGLEHVVLEREETIASSWHRHYDRLHLHTTKTFSSLPMTAWPGTAPRYPSRDQMLDYLQAYAVQHRIEPRFGVAVESVSQSGDGFSVRTNVGVMTPRIVVVATGYNRLPMVVRSIGSKPSSSRRAIHPATGALREIAIEASRVAESIHISTTARASWFARTSV